MNEAVRSVVLTFRNLFVVLGFEGQSFTRSFASFDSPPATWVCEFDASLKGIGIIWLKRTPDGREVAQAWTQVDIRHLGFGKDASFQNTAEYMGSLLCARGLEMLGAAGEPVLLRGDSMSALTWADKGSARSAHATRAAAMWAQYNVQRNIWVVDVVHIAHEYNTRTDILSRQGSWLEVLEDDRKYYGGTLNPAASFLDLHCDELLDLINPSLPLTTTEEFNEFFGQSMNFLSLESAHAHSQDNPARRAARPSSTTHH